MFRYPAREPKNLYDRIIKDEGETVTFRNSDGEPETQPAISREGDSVIVCSDKDGFLRLWLCIGALGLAIVCGALFLIWI